MKIQSLFQPAIQSRWFIIITMLMICNIGVATTGSAREIKWYPDLESATDAAKQQNKLLLMHFTANWCRPCQTLENFVFKNPSIQRAFQQNVIAVKIDVDENTLLVQEYGVASVPSDIAVTPSGRVVSRRKSPKDTSGYERMLAELRNISNGLATGQSPAQIQNLAELQEVMRNDNPVFEGQTTSFTPDVPTHQTPGPSRDSEELKRNSQRIVNPYAQTEPPQSVANAFQPAQEIIKPADAGQLPMTPQQSLPKNVHPKIIFDSKKPQAPGIESDQSPHAVLQSTPKHEQQKASKPAPNHLLIKNNKFDPESTNEFNAKVRGASSREIALQPLEQSDVAARLILEKAQRKLDAFQPEPKLVMGDKFFGTPSHEKIDSRAGDGKSQATIKVSENGDFLPPDATSNQSDKQAKIAADSNSFSPTDEFSAVNSKGLDTSNEASSPIKKGLGTTLETPAKPKFALHGKCPVTLLSQSKWVDGDPKWGCVHRNRIYIFTNEQNLKTFQADPDAHSPILAGFDPVLFQETGRLVDGMEKHGVFMGNAPNQRIVLFSNVETRARFQMKPHKYLDAVRQAMQSSGGASSELVR